MDRIVFRFRTININMMDYLLIECSTNWYRFTFFLLSCFSPFSLLHAVKNM